MMTLRRFRALADSYGADLQRWPEPVRAQAIAFLGGSVEAQAVMSRARELDEAMAAAGAARLERLWGESSPDAAQRRLQENVSARIRRPSLTGSPAPDGTTSSAAMRYPPRRVGWVGFATAAGLAVLAGLALGILYPPPAPQEDLTALLQPAPLQVLTDSE